MNLAFERRRKKEEEDLLKMKNWQPHCSKCQCLHPGIEPHHRGGKCQDVIQWAGQNHTHPGQHFHWDDGFG